MAPKKPTSTQNTTLQTMGMDVIKQYPGPLTVSNSPDPHRAPTLCRFGCAILGLGQAADPPSADPLHDVDMSLLQRASVLQNAAMSE